MDIDTSIFRNKIFQGDCVETLRTMPDNLIDCCITSPPYYGLRDYGIDGQIGLEQTPEEYVAKLVVVFREVRRVLKPEGTLWLNLGDSYCHNVKTHNTNSLKQKSVRGTDKEFSHRDFSICGAKTKDLIGIPWMVAFALRADGWYLRSDIIWHKPNCMPESVTDRPTKSHEYLFLLSKSQRYYYDAEAIKEEATGYDGRKDTKMKGSAKYKSGEHFDNNPNSLAVNGCERWPSTINGLPARNKRTVWTIPTKPYKEAHFATFPEKLIEPCILAGTSERGYCPECGKPWVRQVEHKNMVIRKTDRMAEMGEFGRTQSSGTMLSPAETKTIGWLPSCSCGLDPVPGVVLDPFFGAGTSGLVAKKWGRDFVGIELNPDYIKMAEERIFGPQTL